MRVFFDATAAVVVGRPAKGGIMTKRVNAADLDFLRVSRLEPTPIPEHASLEDEEAWCVQLQRLGVQWWRSFEDWDDASNHVRPWTDLEREHIYIAWPSSGGGAWMLKITSSRRPTEFGKYEMCLDMDERCAILEQLGARFVDDPATCDELSSLRIDRFRVQRDQLEADFGDFRPGC